MKIYEVQKPSALTITEWDLRFHKIMLNDSERMRAFQAAIKEQVKPGDIVVDLGTGTGILAKWALEAGATKVYGIDYNENILEIAKKELSRYDDQFVPILGNSLTVDLPERADVVISETIGNFGDNENCVEYLKDAKKRFLKEGGKMIPESITQMIVPVTVSEVQKQISNIGLLNYYETVIPITDYLSDPVEVNTFNFNEGEDTEYKKKLVFNLDTNKAMTGFKGWFKAKLTDSIILDTETVQEDSSWNHFYIPVAMQNKPGGIDLSLELIKEGGEYKVVI